MEQLGMMDAQRTQTCCFTGHRFIETAHQSSLPALLRRQLELLLEEGVHTFMAGGARGFDTLAAEAVLSLRARRPEARLVVVAPFLGQADGWPTADRARYDAIRDASDAYICLTNDYARSCMARRNRYLVEHSGVCLAYFLHPRSGTAQTLAFAQKRGIPVINLAKAPPLFL